MSGGMEEMSEWEKSYEAKVKAMTTLTTTSLVINDLKSRETLGIKKYGKTLTVDTDEDMLNHLYNELLDASVYIRTLIGQRKKPYNAEL